MTIPPLPPDVADTPVLRAANRLHSTSIHLLRWVRSADRESALSPERLSVLSILAYGGARTVGEIAQMEEVSVPAVSRILKSLERDALVTRERVEEDRRFVRVMASEAGVRLMEGARARRLGRMAALLGLLDDDELALVRSATEILERLWD